MNTFQHLLAKRLDSELRDFNPDARWAKQIEGIAERLADEIEAFGGPSASYRKIIQITSCQVENTSQTQCQMMVTALCDDGTLWVTDNCSMFEGCERQAWHQIRPIPQVDESADLDTASTRP